ncbi:MAG: type II CAAX endopeptidase family protein, partial [Planctomycetota bacterium]|nr:type II CAAX endopeptidase family protein [Planctomycetota bacterium]
PGPMPTPPVVPRIWPTLVVALGVIPVAAMMSTVAIVIALFVGGNVDALTGGGEGMMQWLGEFVATPLGFAVIIAPGQLVFAAAAIVPAILSPRPAYQRLGLGRGRLPLWTFPVLMLATPLVGLLGYFLLLPMTDEPSEQLEFIYGMFTKPTGVFAVVVVVSLSVVPGFVEESLFRGYIQRRLLKRWPPIAAIGFTSFLFAAAHIDPHHFLMVLPIGVWLGIVAWRSGSIWPAILCHFFLNLVGVLNARLSGDSADMQFTFDAPTIVGLAATGLAFIVSVFVLVRYSNRAPLP